MAAILEFQSELFFTYKSPIKFESVGLSVKEKYCGQGICLKFPIGIILANFDLQVAPTLPTKFSVNWPFGSKGEMKNRFSRWRPA